MLRLLPGKFSILSLKFSSDLIKTWCQGFLSVEKLFLFNNKKFWKYVKDFYPSQLNVQKTNESHNLGSYFDLTFTIEKDGKLSTKLYNKRDDFAFHMVNFQFLSNDIPSGPSYGVYISQLIRCARCCSYYDDFRHRHKMLVCRLASHGYRYERLRNSFKTFCGRYQDLTVKYQRSVLDIGTHVWVFNLDLSLGLSTCTRQTIWSTWSCCQLVWFLTLA